MKKLEVCYGFATVGTHQDKDRIIEIEADSYGITEDKLLAFFQGDAGEKQVPCFLIPLNQLVYVLEVTKEDSARGNLERISYSVTESQ